MTKPKKPYDTRIVLHLKLIFQRILLHLQNKNVYVQKQYHNHGNWLYDRFATFFLLIFLKRCRIENTAHTMYGPCWKYGLKYYHIQWFPYINIPEYINKPGCMFIMSKAGHQPIRIENKVNYIMLQPN